MIRSAKNNGQQRQPIAFSPDLKVDDVYAEHWMRQVTIRLRREIQWSWHELGITQTSYDQNTGTLPPFSNRAMEALTQTRNWEKKNNFFKTDATIIYLTEQLQRDIPNKSTNGLVRGSFGWVIEALNLDDTSAFIFALGLLTAYDSAAGTIISACLNDPSKRHPTLSLAQKLWDHPAEIMSVVDTAHPLKRYGLMRYGGQTSHIHSEVDWDDKMEVPSMISNQLLFPDSPIPEYLQKVTSNERDSEFAVTDVERIVAARLRDKNQEILHVVPVLGDKYSSHRDVVRGIGKISNRKVVEFVGDPRALEDIQYLNSLATLCWLKDMDLFLGKEVMSFLTREKQQGDFNFLPFKSIPITIFLGLTEQHQLKEIPDSIILPVVTVPRLSYYERIEYWKKTLGEKANNLDDVISESSRRFRYEKESIDSISRGLKNLSKPISEKDFIDACRAEIEIDLGDLAQPVSPRFEDEELILPQKQSIQFQEILNAMKSLTKVHYGLGTARAWNESGIFVLFSGPSGSGKTMAAEILSVKLNLPMYRIDLSQVVNKYIGETEKNLKKLFDAAEVSDIILFFDEADSIFGRRADVKTAQDIYANQQVSYLLERIERFKGLAVLATNRKKDLDDAFARRLRYVIDFPFPGESERRKIWHQVIPKSVDSSEIDIDFLAKQFQLTGGHIRSIVFNTCLQCVNIDHADENSLKCRPTMKQVVICVRREYEKLGRTISLEHFGQYGKMLKKIGYE